MGLLLFLDICNCSKYFTSYQPINWEFCLYFFWFSILKQTSDLPQPSGRLQQHHLRVQYYTGLLLQGLTSFFQWTLLSFSFRLPGRALSSDFDLLHFLIKLPIKKCSMWALTLTVWTGKWTEMNWTPLWFPVFQSSSLLIWDQEWAVEFNLFHSRVTGWEYFLKTLHASGTQHQTLFTTGQRASGVMSALLHCLRHPSHPCLTHPQQVHSDTRRGKCNELRSIKNLF